MSAAERRRVHVPRTRAHAATLVAVAAAALFQASVGRADIVIKKDGTRVEGDAVDEQGGTVIVRRRRGGDVRIPRAKVARILRTSTSALDRFLAEPDGKTLLTLASRAGRRLSLEKADELAAGLKHAPDVLAEAQRFLDRARLTPEHTAAAVKSNIEEFVKEVGERASVVESRHYFVLTTVGEGYARKVGAYMDGIFREYEKRLVFREKITDKFVIKVFADEKEYFSHGALPGSAAYFSPTRRELVGYRQRSDDLLFRSLYHEGMHQFLHFYVPNPPIWFDEGLAQYFETAQPRAARVRAGVPSYRVGHRDPIFARRARRAASRGEFLPLPRLLSMTKQEFYSPNPEMRGRHYSQAWAFTQFLLESGSPVLKKLWTDYFFALRDGAGQEEVNEQVFGRVDMALLERMFRQYAKAL